MNFKTKQTKNGQSGFAVIEILIIVLVLAIIGFIGWRVMGGKEGAKSKETVSGPLTSEDRQRLAKVQEEDAQTIDQPSTNDSGSNTASSAKPATSGSSGSTSTNKSTATTPASPAQGGGTPTTPTPPSNNFTRPTTAFCQEKDGASFTNAWVTDNSSHTYQVWENGGWVNKTETGTAARNYDTMSVVGVIPYARQAEWAICSDKSGYIMFYYKPTGSVYTYNWLVPFEHVSTTKP